MPGNYYGWPADRLMDTVDGQSDCSGETVGQLSSGEWDVDTASAVEYRMVLDR